MKYHDMPVGTVIINLEKEDVCDLLIAREGNRFTWYHVLNSLDEHVTTVTFSRSVKLDEDEVAFLPEESE